MNQNQQDYDVLSDVSNLIERKLDLMEALGEAMEYRMAVRSRLVCRCPRCLAENSGTMDWLSEMRTPLPVAVAEEPAPPPKGRLTRIFGER
jgi:hypothetical protein